MTYVCSVARASPVTPLEQDGGNDPDYYFSSDSDSYTSLFGKISIKLYSKGFRCWRVNIVVENGLTLNTDVFGG